MERDMAKGFIEMLMKKNEFLSYFPMGNLKLFNANMLCTERN